MEKNRLKLFENANWLIANDEPLSKASNQGNINGGGS